ncbi:hypothetical protein [Janibacter sp. GXQ6167]|uniref:hypothetical protein n=1 Tax=Janibacter sp. GXQ6167 TaxID=3240791 RepID=UPI0035248459
MSPVTPDATSVAALARAAADLSRAAEAIGDELIEHLVLVPDRATRRALDETVDRAVALARTIQTDAADLAGTVDLVAASPRWQPPVGADQAPADAPSQASERHR